MWLRFGMSIIEMCWYPGRCIWQGCRLLHHLCCSLAPLLPAVPHCYKLANSLPRNSKHQDDAPTLAMYTCRGCSVLLHKGVWLAGI